MITDPTNAYLDYNYKPDKYWNFNKLCSYFCIKENDNQNIKNKIKNADFVESNFNISLFLFRYFYFLITILIFLGKILLINYDNMF